jgi:CMP-N,N'-diacetyllegionaminic acid synthase
MYKNKKILAIIPARHGSKGLPGKNWKKLSGKPLIAWSILQAKKSNLIDKIVVSTDSEKIINILKNEEIEIIKRNDSLALDDTPMFDVLKDIMTSNCDFDYVLLLQPTSPLRKDNDIDKFIKSLIDDQSTFSSIVSVCKVDTWANPDNCFSIDGKTIKKFNNGLLKVKTRQEVKNNYYFPNGSMFMSNYKSLLSKKTFYQNNLTMGYIMGKWQQFDIDDADDFLFVELMMKIKGVTK